APSSSLSWCWTISSRLLATSHRCTVVTTTAGAGRVTTVHLWEVASRRELMVQHHDKLLEGAIFSPDGKLVLTSSENQGTRIWEAASGREVAVLPHGDRYE